MIMHTSLQGIANKARKERKYRFRNLYTMLNQTFIEGSWKYLNLNSAAGVDGLSVREFGRKLPEHVKVLVEQLKRKRYHAKLVKRVYIPKDNGKKRPLGLPVVIDKLLQMAVARILNAIYEEDFLPCSQGYRPGIGPHDAVRNLSKDLRFGRFNYVVEVDIKGYFDNINHDWLQRMLEERIADRPFIYLIRKWLRAGILDTDGKVIHPATGTPQGGIVSPILANIYLHYALDLWFERIVKRKCEGAAYLIRYADDFVCAFQYRYDAEKFYAVLPKRLKKFGLEVAPDKTRIIKFSRLDRVGKNMSGKSSFTFLGLEFRWGISRKGTRIIKRRTARKKLKKALANVTEFCREKRSLRMKVFFKGLNSRLRGHYNYYGVIGNYRSLMDFFHQARRIIFKWLNRRSQKKSFDWERFEKILVKYDIVRPRITESRVKQLQFSF